MPRRLGQHFLRDQRIVAQIVRALRLDANDHVVEIGAGRGVLTRQLARAGSRVTAIEIDRGLVKALQNEFDERGNVSVIHANALDLDPCMFGSAHTDVRVEPSAYKLAGNLPYYITGSLLRHYLGSACRPRMAVLMIQLEVAQRMLATPGDMNLLAVATQLYAQPSLVVKVPASAFAPPPKVESAVVKLDVLAEPLVPHSSAFFTVVRAGFSTRRKQLANALANGLGTSKSEASLMLKRADIDPTRRAQDLSLEDWGRLSFVAAELGVDSAT